MQNQRRENYAFDTIAIVESYDKAIGVGYVVDAGIKPSALSKARIDLTTVEAFGLRMLTAGTVLQCEVVEEDGVQKVSQLLCIISTSSTPED